MTDCEINNDLKIIKCMLCPKVRTFNATVDAYGCWKITTFVAHLKAVHISHAAANNQQLLPTVLTTEGSSFNNVTSPVSAPATVSENNFDIDRSETENSATSNQSAASNCDERDFP